MDIYSEIKIGQILVDDGAVVDHSAVIGYLSPRIGVSQILKLGKNARVRSGTVIYAGSEIGDYLETGHNSVIREENIIGNHFSIWNNSVIDYGCKIGDNVKIHCNVYVAQFTTIEDDVFIAPGVKIANDYHPGCPDSKECMKGPTLKKGCKIGVNSTLLPYVNIGEGSLIGSGSVVTKDIPAGVLAYGNPARIHGRLEDLKCKTGIREAPYL